jgi:hypothetical protein
VGQVAELGERGGHAGLEVDRELELVLGGWRLAAILGGARLDELRYAVAPPWASVGPSPIGKWPAVGYGIGGVAIPGYTWDDRRC